MVDFAFYVLWILAFSALQVISLSWGELKRLKANMLNIEHIKAVLYDAQESRIRWLEGALNDARLLLDEFEYDGSAGWTLCRFFSSSNPIVSCFRIGAYWYRIKKMRERHDKILAEQLAEMRAYCYNRCTPVSFQAYVTHNEPNFLNLLVKKIIFKLTGGVTNFFFGAWELIGHRGEQKKIAGIVGVCVDPFFLYIPFLSYTKMCLGINRELWKVAVALRTVADFFTSPTSFRDLCRCMSPRKSILSMCVNYVVLAPIPQILFSEKFILKTLRGYTFWNLILFSLYGARLVLVFQTCEKLKTRVPAPVYLFLYFIVSHVIGASWYYLSIKRQLSCWQHACKIDTGCIHGIFHCDGTTTSTLNSTLYNQFCPINPPNAAVFNYGIYLDALQSRIVEEEGVLKKCLRCFFWGLRNLSSFASNLHTRTNDGETIFAIIICFVALILLIYIIGNIQGYSELARSEMMVCKMEPIEELMEPIEELIGWLVVFHNLNNRTKKSIMKRIRKAFENGNKSFNLERLRIYHFLNDVNKTESVLKDLRLLEEWVFNGPPDNLRKAKKWLSDNNIPPYRNNILFYLACRLKNDEDLNLTSVLSVLPDESKWMTMKDLCFDTLKKVPGLQNIDDECFKSMSRILKPVIYPVGSYIFRQGEPLRFIIFITNGIACSSTTLLCRDRLQKGHFFGEQLVQFKLDKIRDSEWELEVGELPCSTADVESLTQVEAFVLTIEDLINWTYPPQPEAFFSIPVQRPELRRIIRKVMLVNALRKRTADSVTEGVDSSSQTEEGDSVPLLQREIEEVEHH